ncbi:MAG: pseudouridine-5'-phosphate glycosidase [Candidatus Cloacimonetes bacterium]|nr:pseudouridine-5'-phosphate glycosidase [Candidatus Cloacimonadota bacterium]
MDNGQLRFSEEVADALSSGLAVVALESTIIAHGMPFPQNLETARHLEEIVRENGCCPATVFLRDGFIRIGTDDDDLEFLSQAKDVKKVTTRDLAETLVNKWTGATTVAATMHCANMAGIEVFATGGIGGVHRGVEMSFDISADLTELQRTPVIVVSAGAKAILDIGKTLEFLETAGVPVYGWQTASFPGFYSAKTPWKVNRINEVKTIAEIFKRQREIGLNSGMLIANPIAEEFEIAWDKMALIIEQAIADMEILRISGKGVTPFLLNRIKEITEGCSLTTNIRLVESNVKLACEIGKQLIIDN